MTSVEAAPNTLGHLDFQPACSVGHDHDHQFEPCSNEATHLVTGHDCTLPDADPNGYASRLFCSPHVTLAITIRGPLSCRHCGRLFLDVRHWFPRIVPL